MQAVKQVDFLERCVDIQGVQLYIAAMYTRETPGISASCLYVRYVRYISYIHRNHPLSTSGNQIIAEDPRT